VIVGAARIERENAFLRFVGVIFWLIWPTPTESHQQIQVRATIPAFLWVLPQTQILPTLSLTKSPSPALRIHAEHILLSPHTHARAHTKLVKSIRCRASMPRRIDRKTKERGSQHQHGFKSIKSSHHNSLYTLEVSQTMVQNQLSRIYLGIFKVTPKGEI